MRGSSVRDTQHRPPLGLQACTGEWTTERSNPVLPCDGRARNTDDLRAVSTGQGPCGTSGRHLPGQTCNRASTRGCDHHRRCWCRSEDFLPHFNERFGVSAPESEVAYRPVGTCLDRMLCFRHSRKVAKDNTVRYRRSTLQLLPGMERPTYAGVKVDALEGMDGQLVVEHEGQLIPSHEAPPRPNILRGVNGYPSHAPPYRNGLGSRWERVLASLDRERAEENDRDDSAAKVRKKATSAPRKPTPKQIARWERFTQRSAGACPSGQ